VHHLTNRKQTTLQFNATLILGHRQQAKQRY
jgi:hypothetical protein